MCALMYACMYVCMYGLIMHIQVCSSLDMLGYAHIHMHTHIHIYIHTVAYTTNLDGTHVHTYTHIHMHTHIHIYIHTVVYTMNWVLSLMAQESAILAEITCGPVFSQKDTGSRRHELQV